MTIAEREHIAAELEQLREELKQRENDRAAAIARRRDSHALVKPGLLPTSEEIAAEHDVEAVDRDIARLKARIQTREEKVVELAREADEALGRELFEDLRQIDASYPNAKLRLTRAILATVDARAQEHGLDVRRHQVRMELDKLAERTGDRKYRQGVFAFDGAYRPQLERIGDAAMVLMEELGVSLVDGKIVARETARGTTGTAPIDEVHVGNDAGADVDDDLESDEPGDDEEAAS
jgi:hypothetical protein